MDQYTAIKKQLMQSPFDKVAHLWEVLEGDLGDQIRQWLAKNDRFYLLVRVLGRKDLIHPWLYERCREVECDPDGYLDLWGRDHRKSTIITYGGAIQEVIKEPEVTIGIFSHTKPISKGFLRQIKVEFESNLMLRALFPDIFWENPERDAPSWSLDFGLTVNRKTNPSVATIEAHGLVDGQPIGKHFQILIYDDVVVPTSVSTPEQVMKTTEAFKLSDNLGVIGGRKWMTGTRYSFADSYEEMLTNKTVKPRIYPATDDGTIDGKPVFLPQEEWDKKVIAQGPEVISCQMLQNPQAGINRMFNLDDIRVYEARPEVLNVYITVDPARSMKKDSAKTAVAVIGMDYASNKYLLDGYNHKMDLRERWVKTSTMYHKWKRESGVQHVWVGYEAYGAQADLDYFEEQMRRPNEGGFFHIEELKWPRDGEGSKTDRVGRLGPDFRMHKFYVPIKTDENALTNLQRRLKEAGQGHRIARQIKRVDENKKIYDLTEQFKQQVNYFPFGKYKDLIDAVSRVYDLAPKAPSFSDLTYAEPEYV